MKKKERDSGPNRLFERSGQTPAQFRQIGLAFAIPGFMLAGPLVGYFLGWATVTYLGAPEWAKVAGLALGFVSGIRETFLALKKLNQEQGNRSDGSRSGQTGSTDE